MLLPYKPQCLSVGLSVCRSVGLSVCRSVCLSEKCPKNVQKNNFITKCNIYILLKTLFFSSGASLQYSSKTSVALLILLTKTFGCHHSEKLHILYELFIYYENYYNLTNHIYLLIKIVLHFWTFMCIGCRLELCFSIVFVIRHTFNTFNTNTLFVNKLKVKFSLILDYCIDKLYVLFVNEDCLDITICMFFS